jgi:hypothetical protein
LGIIVVVMLAGMLAIWAGVLAFGAVLAAGRVPSDEILDEAAAAWMVAFVALVVVLPTWAGLRKRLAASIAGRLDPLAVSSVVGGVAAYATLRVLGG